MIRRNVIILSVVTGSVGLCQATLSAQQNSVFARLQPDNTVELLQVEKNRWRNIYRSPGSTASALSTSSSGGRVAFLSWTEGTFKGHDYDVLPAAQLVVIDTAGRHIASVPNVQRYDWCGPACLIYITGVYQETDVGFHPTGVAMIDLVTGTRTELPAPPYPIGIRWGPHDGAAYLKNAPEDDGEPRIFRVDLQSRTLSQTELKDHMFSPTGRYYLHRPHFSDSVQLYETRSNTPVDISKLWRNAKPIGWAAVTEDVLLTIRRDPAKASKPGRRGWLTPLKPGETPKEEIYQLYRIRDARVVGQVKARLGPGASPADFRVVRQGDSYKILDQR
jgi:hypothetical protein